MRKFAFVVLAVLMSAVLIGCAQQQTKPSDEAGKTVDAQQNGKTGPSAADISAAAREIDTKVGNVYFAYDKYDLDGKAQSTLKRLASVLGKSRVGVTIEGNCDERGTKEYNLALGDKRAAAAKQFLVSVGISPDRISTVSYGKEKPVCTESSEACWAKNRRDHFAVTEAGN
jgi:peptidoglycan-associated lipoprotein